MDVYTNINLFFYEGTFIVKIKNNAGVDNNSFYYIEFVDGDIDKWSSMPFSATILALTTELSLLDPIEEMIWSSDVNYT